MSAKFRTWKWLPRIELVKFKPIDFFPPPPTQFKQLCLASKTRTIGDALVLTPIARKLKTKYPDLKLTTYIRGFNPVVFYNNPYMDGISYTPDKIYGDDCNDGTGQLIQLKERFFGLDISVAPKPELFTTAHEKTAARKWIQNNEYGIKKPICIIHPWGHTHQNVAPVDYWEYLVENWKYKIHFIQVGVSGHTKVTGCHQYALFSRGGPLEGPWGVRSLFALIEQADFFIGVDSGPMHIARAFDKKSLILSDLGNIESYLERRRKTPYYLDKVFEHSFIYEENTHLDMTSLGVDQALERSHHFIGALA